MARGLKQQLCRFAKAERGALLVFFAMCCAAIFLIAALSFDLGKRASTQADLQSFADNVALAAAGELDGQPGAIARAQNAANRLIRDEATFASDDRELAGAADFRITFHAMLPDNEALFATPLNPTTASSDELARFARVEATPVSVPWSFARLLRVFSAAPLPSDAVAAEATAGFSALACDVAPIFFCMPPPEGGVDTNGIWNPGNHIGDAIRLTATSGGPSNWRPGSVGFYDASGLMDLASPCVSPPEGNPFSCLLGIAGRRTQCFENGGLALLDGTGERENTIFLNTRQDRYLNYGQLARDSDFRAPPITTKPISAATACRGNGGLPTNDATDFLADDCMIAGSCGAVGDGNWFESRMTYVDTNYSLDGESIGIAEAGERITVLGDPYHVDDPFRPGDATHPRRPEYQDFPVVPNGASRWNYYNAEVAAAYFQDPAAAYGPDSVDLTLFQSALREDDPLNPRPDVFLKDISETTYPIDLLPDMTMADGSIVPRLGSSLPQCARAASLDPRRRAIIAAAIDCNSQPLDGSPAARAAWFVELFMLDVVRDPSDTGSFSFNAEVMSGGLQNDGALLPNGAFRNFAQLFR
ncbi:MAG: hypothetical protein OIF48_20870 [Silicimonas sp.]|nr:hypothetical protein [Silicimonas sp.]